MEPLYPRSIIHAMTDLIAARPAAAAWRAFAIRLLNAAGIGALGAGIIFFVAANWQDYGLMGRFALLVEEVNPDRVFAGWRCGNLRQAAGPPRAIVLPRVFSGRATAARRTC